MKQTGPIGIYAHLITFFISELENGIVPWHRPWTLNGIPMNLLTTMPYAGINTLYLGSLGYSENFFLTYEELKALHASVKDDEKGYPVILGEHTVKTEDGGSLEMISQTIVFNIAQCTGLPKDLVPPIEVPANPLGMCYELVHNMPNKPVIRHQGDRAYYRSDIDLVLMPLMK
jgi:antirestriction protein ArdC